MVQVALTGGIAAGKSTVADMFAKRGATIIDSDLLAREVVQPGTPGLEAVAERFGDGVLDPDGALDRAALARIIFDDDQARAELNAIVHPLVRRRRADLIASADDGTLVISVIPLLVETGGEAAFDEVIVVDVPVEQQLARLRARNGYDEREAWARIRAQASREARRAAATRIIDNSRGHDRTLQQVEQVYSALSARIRESTTGRRCAHPDRP